LNGLNSGSVLTLNGLNSGSVLILNGLNSGSVLILNGLKRKTFIRMIIRTLLKAIFLLYPW